MIDSQPPILYSRSHCTTDWTCPRKRWWNFQYAGRGIQSGKTAFELWLGTVLHDGLAGIAHGVDIDEIAKAAVKQMRDSLLGDDINDQASIDYADEQAALVEGLLRGFRKHIWPIWMEDYPEIVYIEKEMIYQHDGLTFMSKPDLVVRDKEGELWAIEYKSTSSDKEQWVNSWTTAVQVHSIMRAVEADTGEKLAGVIIQGLYKGYWEDRWKRQSSIFCHAYHKPGNPPFSQDIWQIDYKYGFKKYPIWKREGGVKRWVAEMDSSTLADQFPSVPPIFLNDTLIDTFFRERSERELEIAVASRALNDPAMPDAVKQEVLDVSFPHRWDQCKPPWGRDDARNCEYLKLCHGPQVDPLKVGFQLRVSHHSTEAEYHEKMEVQSE